METQAKTYGEMIMKRDAKLLAQAQVIAKMREMFNRISEEWAWKDRGHLCQSRIRLEAIVKRAEEALALSESAAEKRVKCLEKVAEAAENYINDYSDKRRVELFHAAEALAACEGDGND